MTTHGLSPQETDDRIALKALFEKRLERRETKEGFFYFENQSLMIAQKRETYVVVSGDIAIGFPLFLDGEADFPKFVQVMEIIRHRLGNRIDTLWDVGANIGAICIPALARDYVKHARAFEPEGQLFKLLRVNSILNEVDGQLVCIQTALGRERGQGQLMTGVANTGDY